MEARMCEKKMCQEIRDEVNKGLLQVQGCKSTEDGVYGDRGENCELEYWIKK